LEFILLKFAFSALVIVIAGTFLTKYADKIADLTGWGKLFVGSLILAGATSLPELSVNIKSVRLGLPDLAVGDLLGSSLINILILAVLDFAYPSTFRRTVFSPQNIHHSLSAVLSMMLTSLVGLGIATRIDLSFYHVSLITWSIVIVYFYGVRLLFIERVAPEEIAVSEPPQRKFVFKKKELSVAFFGLITSALVILFSSPYLVDASDELARLSGLGHTFIGTTLVAFATSLPELVATLAAFRMGSPDLAIGNIFGSNAFNMLTFAPLDFLYPKVLFHEVQSSHLVTVFGVLLTTGIAVMGQLYRKKERSRFTEPSSETVVVVILVVLYLLFIVNGESP